MMITASLLPLNISYNLSERPKERHWVQHKYYGGRSTWRSLKGAPGRFLVYFWSISSVFDGPFHPITAQTGSLRCRGWILRVEKLAFGVSRAPGGVWDPFPDIITCQIAPSDTGAE